MSDPTINWESLDTSWADANVDKADSGTDYAPVPDGPYVCCVDRVEFRESKAGNPYLNWVLVVDNGPHEGRWLFKRNMLGNAQNMSFLKKDIAACGVDLPPKLSDFDLGVLLDVKVKVTKKTKGDFENIYIDKVVPGVKGDSDNRIHAATTIKKEFKDDDIPF